MSVVVFLRIEIPYIEEMHSLDKDKQYVLQGPIASLLSFCPVIIKTTNTRHT